MRRILALTVCFTMLCGTPALATVDGGCTGQSCDDTSVATADTALAPHHYLIGGKPVALSDAEAQRQQRCLGLVAFGEARSEGRDGMLAIVFVVMNRLRAIADGDLPPPPVAKDRKILPCDVVAQKGAFESLRHARFHRALLSIRRGRAPLLRKHDDPTERQSLELADTLAHDVMTGKLTDDVTRGATHFYCPAEQRQLRRRKPEWTETMVATAYIGKQVFYRQEGS